MLKPLGKKIFTILCSKILLIKTIDYWEDKVSCLGKLCIIHMFHTGGGTDQHLDIFRGNISY